MKKLFSKNNILLATLLIFCLSLSYFRFIKSDSINYQFLVWNIFLAIIPYAITQFIIIFNLKNNYLHVILFSIWILFLPNSPYIITDLMHLKYHKTYLLWFDALLIFSYAFNGLLLGVFSLIDFYKITNDKFNKYFASVLVFVISILCGFGVYLGRFLRWNSWYVIQNPKKYLELTFLEFFKPSDDFKVYSITLTIGFIFWISFLILHRKQEQIV